MSQQVTIPAGSTTASQPIVVFGDIDLEATENFTVVLSNPIPANVSIQNVSAAVTISNDDFTDVTIDTVAGSGLAGPDCGGDGGLAELATFNRPYGVSVDLDGNLYVNDINPGSDSATVRRVDAATGTIDLFAGTCGSVGFAGDGGQADAALIDDAFGTAVDPDGNVYIADSKNHVIRRVDAVTGIITSFAGGGTRGYTSEDEGAAAAGARLNSPLSVEWYNGELYIADYLNHRIRRVDGDGNIWTVVGANTGNQTGDNAKGFIDNVDANDARLEQPKGIAFDSAGNMYFADRENHRVRRVDAVTNIITTVAGTGATGFSGDGEPAVDARLFSPRDVVIDEFDNIYVADTTNRRVRVIEAGTGIITTYAGNGRTGGDGDGGPALEAEFGSPYDMDIGPDGVIYVADDITSTRRIRALFPSVSSGDAPVWNGDAIQTSNLTGTSVDISWTAPTDADGVAGYDVFVDGNQIGSTTATSLPIVGLASGQSFEISIEAEDVDGNRSTTGPSVTVTTP